MVLGTSFRDDLSVLETWLMFDTSCHFGVSFGFDPVHREMLIGWEEPRGSMIPSLAWLPVRFALGTFYDSEVIYQFV